MSAVGDARKRLYSAEEVGDLQASEAELVAAPLRRALRDMEIERNMLRTSLAEVLDTLERVKALADEGFGYGYSLATDLLRHALEGGDR